MTKLQDFEWTTDENVHIHAQKWLPEGEVSSVIIMVHGLGEHIARYDHVARFFNDQNIAFYGSDHQGHGKSSGKRGHIARNQVFISEIDKIIDIARYENPNKPIFLYGHSLGGNMVLYYTLKRKPQIKGIICTSPGLGVGTPVPPAKLFMAKIMKSLLPSLTLDNGLDVNNLSHNPEVIKEYQEDPLVHPMISAKLAMDMFSNGDWTIENAANWDTPLLLMVGTNDHTVSQDKIKQFVANVPKNFITFKPFPGLYHELHNEYESNQVLSTIFEWMNKQ